MTFAEYISIFPIVFMIHELEELIMLKPWMERNRAMLSRRFGKSRLSAVLQLHDRISPGAFSLIVAEEFIIVAVISFVSAQFSLHNLFLGMVFAFQLHLFIHIFQFIALRIYVPALVTSIVCSAYILPIVTTYSHDFHVETVAGYTLLCFIVLIANLAGCFRMAIAFDRRLKKYSEGGSGE